MMFMHRSSLPAVASHLGREDNSGLDGVDVGVGVSSGMLLGDEATRTRTGVGMEDSVGVTRATSETVKHAYGDGGDDVTGQSQGVGVDVLDYMNGTECLVQVGVVRVQVVIG